MGAGGGNAHPVKMIIDNNIDKLVIGNREGDNFENDAKNIFIGLLHLVYVVLCWTIIYRETLIKSFPAPDLRHEVPISLANPCVSRGASKEILL
jgi:hypothetical protein